MEMQAARRKVLTPPPKQNPYGRAYELGFDALTALPLTAERQCALGVTVEGGAIYVPVFHHRLRVVPVEREVYLDTGGRVKRAWGLLALHYLSARELTLDTREVSLAHFDDCRGYLSVFNKRIISRFLATTGRSAAMFIERSEALRGTRRPGPGIGYRFSALPRIPITVIRHDDDEEFGADATVIYQADIAHLLPAEDRVVVVELLLEALGGKPIEEISGGTDGK